MAGSLTAAQVLDIWEVSAHQHPLERALAVLAAALPQMKASTLADLTIGECEHLLLDVRERTFGPRMECRAECPACHEALEFALTTRDLRVEAGSISQGAILLEWEEWRVTFLLPTIRVLLALRERMGSPGEEASEALLAECVQTVERGESALTVGDLPAEVRAAVVERMAQSDPQSDLTLNLTCPQCGYAWPAPFNVEAYLWAEVRAGARLLLNEVHTLARAYGWSEAEILSMSAARRAMYIEIVTGG